MVDVYRSEEEQIEAIKAWWKKDGLQTVLLVLLVIAGYFGWQYWKSVQQTNILAASDVYQQLLEVDSELQSNSTDELLAKANTLISEIKTNHNGVYAQYAGLLEAKYAVNRDDLATAEKALRDVVKQKPEKVIADAAALRLARVLFAQNKYDEALSELIIDETEAWNMTKYELQGDIFNAQGKTAQAVSAYEKALSFADTNTGSDRFIKMKLNQISVSSTVEDRDE